MSEITEPGIYFDFSAEAYHADPCPAPSLTQSVAKLLLDRSPLHAWTAHPRLNPSHERDDPSRFDIGNVAHRLLTGRGKDVEVVDEADWRKNAAKEAREAALTAGRLPILRKDADRVEAMVSAAARQLRRRGISGDWESGRGEVVIAWKEEGAWSRTMIDWLTDDRLHVWDYKTTHASASPDAVAWKLADDGWDIQSAQHERGLDSIHPEGMGRRKHFYLVQEDYEPFALTVVQLPNSALTMGRKKLAVARAIWGECIRTGQWPGYATEVVMPEYPAAAEARWLSRELNQFANVHTDLLPAPEPETTAGDFV